MFYRIVLPALTVLAFASRGEAESGAGDQDLIVSEGDEKLPSIETPVLVALYNRGVQLGGGKRSINKFADRETAVRRTKPVIEYLAEHDAGNVPLRVALEDREASSPKVAPVEGQENTEVATMATTKTRRGRKAASKSTRKTGSAKGAAASTNGRRGRPSEFAGKVITRLVKENPRREGTFGYKSFALIKDGMTYEDYLAKGGRREDLAWDVERKYVAVKSR